MAANKYVPIKTKPTIYKTLLNMTGDEDRYGGKPTVTLKKAQGPNDVNKKLDHKA